VRVRAGACGGWSMTMADDRGRPWGFPWADLGGGACSKLLKKGCVLGGGASECHLLVD